MDGLLSPLPASGSPGTLPAAWLPRTGAGGSLLASGCPRLQETGRRKAGPDECLGREERVREENNSTHLKRESLSQRPSWGEARQVGTAKAESLVRGRHLGPLGAGAWWESRPVDSPSAKSSTKRCPRKVRL